MKKYLGILVMCLMLIIPINVMAKASLSSELDSEDSSKATYKAVLSIADGTSISETKIVLTPEGGATIDEVKIADNASLDWSLTYTKDANGVWTVTVKSLNGPVTSWNEAVFTYTFTKSGHEDCNVNIGFGKTETTTEKNPQTGSTLPYIALGAIVIGATALYLSTKNKSKMYKI